MAESERGVEDDDEDAGEDSGLGGGSRSPARSLPEEAGERVEPPRTRRRMRKENLLGKLPPPRG
eukprot:15548717-Heterocapsa_arctica.AAC.1